jgi:flagellar protein FliS
MALTGTTTSRQNSARNRYMSDSVHTMSPSLMVTRLYDKLVSELERAEPAMSGGDLYSANDALVRAQAIILELRSALNTQAWAGGPKLAALYDFFVREIIQANVSRDAGRIASIRKLIEPLCEAWHAAAAQLAAEG